MYTKKILLIGALLLLIHTETSAQEALFVPDYQNDPINCPENIVFRSITEEHADACQKNNYSEILTGSPTAPSAFMTEIQRFNDQTITPIYQDHPSHSSQLIESGIFDLRRHKQCLKNICQIIFEQCTDQSGSIWGTSNILNQQNQCNEKVDGIMIIEQEKLKKALYLNQSRKSQEVPHQQTTALLSRIRRHLTPALTNMSRQLARMVSKIPILIKSPTTPGNTGS